MRSTMPVAGDQPDENEQYRLGRPRHPEDDHPGVRAGDGDEDRGVVEAAQDATIAPEQPGQVVDAADRQHGDDADAVDDRRGAGRRPVGARTASRTVRQIATGTDARCIAPRSAGRNRSRLALDHRRRHRHLLVRRCRLGRRDARPRQRSVLPRPASRHFLSSSRPRRASLRVAASRSRSHCSIADNRSLRMHRWGSAASSCARSTAPIGPRRGGRRD